MIGSWGTMGGASPDTPPCTVPAIQAGTATVAASTISCAVSSGRETVIACDAPATSMVRRAPADDAVIFADQEPRRYLAAITGCPASSSGSMTASQLEDSAKAPWTRTCEIPSVGVGLPG